MRCACVSDCNIMPIMYLGSRESTERAAEPRSDFY